MIKKNRIKYLILVLIVFNILLSARWVIDGNILFHTDIARDFLLMEDIVNNRHFTLIGPRSGAIPGLFHGPLWLYLNLPSFVIGGGNPAFVGWFWVALYILSILIIYFVGKKIFGKEEGMLGAALLSSVTILQVKSLFNPYGALLLTPLFFYFFRLYLQTKKFKILVLSFFLLGLIIQFQMAFGVPILILTLLFLIYYLFKSKKLSHLLSVFILLIPLSTHLLFDLRNNFLQVRSVISYINGLQNHGKLDLNMFQLISLRLKEVIIDGLGIIAQGNIYLTISLLLFILITVFVSFKKRSKNLQVYFLIIYFYLGFWFFTIFFKGPVWNYYFLPFIPLLILLFVALKNELNKVVFYIIFICLMAVNLLVGIKDTITYNTNVAQQDVSTWKFNKLVAKRVFEGSENSFGYFIFTPDLYGYSPRYALDFYQKNSVKRVTPYQKQKVTYLVIAPAPEYGRDPNSIWYQKNTNSAIWKSNDVRIIKQLSSTVVFKNGFVIEKYDFTDAEINIAPNPYLIKDIFFR